MNVKAPPRPVSSVLPPKCAARHALDRLWYVAYETELEPLERRGMRALQVAGEVLRDEGAFGDVHWHRRPVELEIFVIEMPT